MRLSHRILVAMTAAGVLGSVAVTSAFADSTSNSSVSSPQAAAITQCLTARHQATGTPPISMADVGACAPGARQLALGAAITAAGTYFTPTPGGVDLSLMQISALPSSNDDPCNYYSYTNWEADYGAETFGATMCYNGSDAWAYSLSTTCTSFPPYTMSCGYAREGVIGNYTSTVNPWANWFNTYDYGICAGERELRMYLTRSGGWSEHSYNAGPC